MKYTPDLLERFWAKVDKAGDCWEWTAAKTLGYGRFSVYGRLDLAHRVSWSIANGEIPAAMTVDHMCFNPGCVNPLHLRLLTREENAAIRPPWYEHVVADACPKGHPTTTPESRSTSRRCRVCHRDQNREHMRRVRAKSAA